MTELGVHTSCGRVRGPVVADDGGRAWQSCPCEDEPIVWADRDVSQAVALCQLCARGSAGGSTRWAWLACRPCLLVNRRLRDLGYRPLPLGRHSLLNGVGVAGGRPLQVMFAEAMPAFDALFVGWSELRAWSDREYRRFVDLGGWNDDVDVPLSRWQAAFPPSTEASIDALRRFTGVDLTGLEP